MSCQCDLCGEKYDKNTKHDCLAKLPTDWFCDKEQEEFKSEFGLALNYKNLDWKVVVNSDGVFAINESILFGDPAFQPWEENYTNEDTMKGLKTQIKYLLEDWEEYKIKPNNNLIKG